ncbi:MAG: DUF2786 domain-containing protein [Candidatus Electrothrix sp. GW3-4]|uniref:DUF2786 domain-containing protein n=1 Tax=Candidatus Electrothrix sp. GW3-4 TaxID=3126740 RepID=UPI0030D54CE1
MTSIRIREAAQQAWLEQLVHEFKTICFQYRVQLRLPIFELSAAKQQLGCWISAQRILRISEHLIVSSSWDVVLMVLKHEMAHQLCSEYFRLQHAGHGQEFQKACQLLGVSAPYNRATGDLDEVIAEPSGCKQTAEGRRIIRRINKLLRLAGSENEHEAALAMQRATELLHRHNRAMSALGNPPDCVRLSLRTGKKQIPSWRKAICRILRDYFFVEVIFSSLYDAQRQESYKTIELLGRSENVPVAEHCYYFLQQQLESLWKRNRQRFQGNARTAKNSYYLGLLHGFAQKLAEQAGNIVQEKTPQGNENREGAKTAGELIISKDGQLQGFVGFHFPRLQTRSVQAVRIHQYPYEEAVAAGKDIILHRSLTEKKQGGKDRLISC